MSDAAEIIEEEKNEQTEEFSLSDLKEEEERLEAEQEALENQPDQSEIERARAFAEKLNTGFLFGVNRLVCPSVVDIDEVVDREAGNEALLPLAMELGGDVPPWVLAFQEKYGPWIKAGVYMGTTIYTLKKVEMMLQEEAEKAKKADEQGGNSESES